MPERQERDWSTYASPVFRMGVAMLVHPGLQLDTRVVSKEAFPPEFRDFRGSSAVQATITLPDGRTYVGLKEVETEGRGRNNTTYAVRPTPELLEKSRTAAVGRALKLLGVPSAVAELQLLMQFHAVLALRGATPDHREALQMLTAPIEGDASHEEADPDEMRAGFDEPDGSDASLEQARATRSARDRASDLLYQMDGDQKRRMMIAMKEDPALAAVKNPMQPGEDVIDRFEALAEQILSGEK